MSTLLAPEPTLAKSTPTKKSAATPRVWPAIVLLAIYWSIVIAAYSIELSMFMRFMSRFIALAATTLLFLVWWLAASRVRWSDRLLAPLLVVTLGVVTKRLADPSIDGFGLALMTAPFALTLWAGWVLISRHWSFAVQRTGFVAAMVVLFGAHTLIRWEGLDGNQHNELAWRWTPSAEQMYLEGLSKSDMIGPPPKTTLRGWSMQPGDWPEFRGVQRDGIVSGIDIATTWKEKQPPLEWKHRVGPGWSSVIIVDGRLVTQEQRGDNEAVVCYDAATGEEAWSYEYPARYSEVLAGAGPRGTPTFSGGRIFSFGAKGHLVCLSAADGKLMWTRDVLTDSKAELPMWGYSTSPLVVDGKVIVFAGGKDDRSLMAFYADSGEIAWTKAGGKSTYSSPQLATIAGVKQILMHDSSSLAGVAIEDGALLWERKQDSSTAPPMLQPHVLNANELLIELHPGVALIEVQKSGEKWSVTDRWTSERLKPTFNDFAVHEGFVYGLDDGILVCLDAKTGQRVWKKGRYGHGQLMLIADQGLLLVLSEQGQACLVSADPKKYDELGKFQAIEGKTWNHPVIAHGKMYLRNSEEIACFALPTMK